MREEKGFILLYTLLIIASVFILAGVAFSGAIFESGTARTQSESMKAFFAADTGIECVRFFQTYKRAFNPTSAQAAYDCDGSGPMASFLAGGDPSNQPNAASKCVSATYSFALEGFSNNTCTEVEVKVTPREIPGPPTLTVCDLSVISKGTNYPCGTAGPNIVERTRWENM